MRLLLVCAALAWLPSISSAALAQTSPPGPYIGLGAPDHRNADSFKAGKPLIGTSYFYWYDVYSGAHIRDHDGTDALTTHPPAEAMADLSFKSPRWHYTQLQDVAKASIDFIMPVFWGVPGQYQQGTFSWSFAGLPPLVEAHDRMLEEHEEDAQRPAPPKIGLFYDTTTLKINDVDGRGRSRHIDLTTAEGREWFYVTIRDFFSMIPPAKWARIDAKPIVFLYAAEFAAGLNGALFEDTRKRFRADFGVDFFLVRHADWPGRADGWYQWGGALGLTLGDVVAGLGPGYDHSAVPGRQPLVIDRQNGRFYERQWETFLRMHPQRRPWIVHVETWNEWHEGTDVARSKEYGDIHIRATAKYAELFRQGVRLEPKGAFVNAERVRWSAREVGGLTLRPSGGDGCWERTSAGGAPAVASVACPGAAGRYLYFEVDDSYLFDEMKRVAEVVIVYHDDSRCEQFRIEYDNGDPGAGPVGGAFRPGRTFKIGGADTWKTVRVQLPDVRFANRANGADLRLAVEGGQGTLIVREVIVRKLPGELMTP
jgi:hypothetical protein